jgi:hypothetical protein
VPLNAPATRTRTRTTTRTWTWTCTKAAGPATAGKNEGQPPRPPLLTPVQCEPVPGDSMLGRKLRPCRDLPKMFDAALTS